MFLHLQKSVQLFGLGFCSLNLLNVLIVTELNRFKSENSAMRTNCLRLSFKDLKQATVTRRENGELRNFCMTLCPDCTRRVSTVVGKMR